MYAIRLELGREADELQFAKYKQQLEREEIYTIRNRKKQTALIKGAIRWGFILFFFLGCAMFAMADVSKYKELKAIELEIANRPIISEAHPVIDASYVEEVKEQERQIEEMKNATYSAVETETTGDVVSEVDSEYAIVVDINKDEILATRNGKTRINPASMTKILTVLVAAENIKESDLDDEFTITPEITYYSYKNDCSAVGFSDDEIVTVRDLFYGTILPSGGDAALALATYVAGDQDSFVDLMNQKLETLGLSDTAHFTNCIGLYDENHYCTCYDMAMILRAAIENPFCKDVLSTRVYTTSSTLEHPDGIEISNWFLRRIEDKACGGTVMCAKTGYVNQSGNCAASYATDNNGNDFIVVTGNAPGSWKCIYDHVEIYRSYFPGYDAANVDAEAEQQELEETEEDG